MGTCRKLFRLLQSQGQKCHAHGQVILFRGRNVRFQAQEKDRQKEAKAASYPQFPKLRAAGLAFLHPWLRTPHSTREVFNRPEASEMNQRAWGMCDSAGS